MSSKNKSVITKECLINTILDKSKDDFISIEDLLKLIDKATDEDGIISKKRLVKSIRNSHTKSVIKDIYGLLEEIIFNCLTNAAVDSILDIQR